MAKSLIEAMRGAARTALALAACAWAPAAAVHAQTAPLPRGAERAPDAIRPLLGAWDLELTGETRRCTITLGVESAPHGRQLRFPATCRRALPILNAATGWMRAPDGAVQLQDALGKPVITLRDGTVERGFTGTGTDGKAYALLSKNHPRVAQARRASQAEIAATAAQRPTLVDPARAPAPESLPGLYAVMRQPNRESCRIMLAPAPAAGPSPAPAAFEGACRDTGLTIFDPTGWRYGAGRLALIARKGHSVELVFEDGQWRKDPPVGAPLLLRRLAP